MTKPAQVRAAKLLRLFMLVWACMCKWLAKRHLNEPKHILVMVYGGIGDAIMTIPTLALLREKCPNAKITLLASTASGGHTIYRAFPQFYDDIMVISPTPLSWKEAIAHNLMLRRKKFDCVLISYISAYSLTTLLPAMLSVPKQFLVLVDRHPLRKVYEFLFDDRVVISWENDRRSEVLIHQEMLRGVDASYTPAPVEWKWSLALPKTAKENAKQWLQANGLWNKEADCAVRFALIHASTSEAHAYRRYPLKHLAEVVNWIAAQQLAVVAVGSSQEDKVCTELRHLTNAAVVPCTTLGIMDLAALIAHAELFVGNESGPAHISMLLNRPTVRIFGPSSPYGAARWKHGPFEEVFLGIECAPCLRLGLLNNAGLNAHSCGHRNCLALLTPDNVIRAVQRVIDKQSAVSYQKA
jgi:ADP-heptose:LPS heptosyltransferase